MAMEELFVPNTNESQITSRFVARYVAKTAAREVIPAAIDYIMHKTGLSDSTGPNPATAGATSIRNETRQHYNRVQTLERLDDRLAKQLAVDRPRFEAMAGSLVLVSVAGTDAMIGPRVSGMGTPLLTSDPAIIGPPNDCYGTPGWYAGLGVVH
jgi:hypothetical protein